MKTYFILVLIYICGFALVGQNAPSSDAGADRGKETYDEIEKLDHGSNLERKQYREISEKNRERIVNGLKLLTIMSANFGDEVPESKAGLDKIRKDYQVALRYYYRNAFIVSGKSIQKVERDISDLLSKYAKKYDDKTQTILSECADMITEQDQAELVVGSQENPKTVQAVFPDSAESKHKLKIAYYQLSLALAMVKENRFYEALVHYRISKDYGIKILSDLKESEADKKLITDKYAKDLADNRNLISETNAPAK